MYSFFCSNYFSLQCHDLLEMTINADFLLFSMLQTVLLHIFFSGNHDTHSKCGLSKIKKHKNVIK